MPTLNPTGWCPRCQQNVLLKREEIDTCLAIILLIFTAGIGLIIYLAIHFSHPEKNCIHCGAMITVVQDPIKSTYQSHPLPYINAESSLDEIAGTKLLFCSLCGEKLDMGTKFCPNCGSQITEN